MSQQNFQVQRLESVNIHYLSEKCKSKKELYHFLAQDCEAFLPRVQSTNIYFLKQIVRGSKEYIKRQDVKVSAVPHIEGLTIEDFIEYTRTKPQIMKYLPDQRDWVHIDRQWLCDIIYTLDNDNFQQKINQAMTLRKEKLEKNRNLIVEMRPEFAEALNNCLNFSHERGRSASLLKNSSKRKRLRSEIEDVKEEEIELKKDRQNFLQDHKRLKHEKEILQQQLIQLSQVNEEYAEIFGQQIEQQENIQFQI